MDNAAKALVIAGGLLIGMLIITLSMYLYTSFQDAYSASMRIHDSVEIEAFNTYFTKFGYTKDGSSTIYVSGADAYNILSRAYDVCNDDYSISRFIEVTGTAGFSIDKDSPAFYERFFYYSEMFQKEFIYKYDYDLNGIVDEIILDNVGG